MSDATPHWERLYDGGVEEGLACALARKKQGHVTALGVAVAVFSASWWGFGFFPGWFAGEGRAGDGVNHFSMILFALVPGALAWRFVTAQLQKSALKILGERVLAPIARSVDSDMRYDADKAMGVDVLDASLLFGLGGDGIVRLGGGGVFQGTIFDDEFAFASLCADKRMRHGCRLRGGRIFDGLFLRLRTKRKINGFIAVMPRASGVDCEVMRERLALQRRESVVEIPLTEHAEADRWFRRFASDEAAARHFQPSIAKWMAELFAERRWRSSYSHKGEEIYIAIDTGRAHWGLPGSDLDAARREACREYFDDVAFMRGLASRASEENW